MQAAASLAAARRRRRGLGIHVAQDVLAADAGEQRGRAHLDLEQFARAHRVLAGDLVDVDLELDVLAVVRQRADGELVVRAVGGQAAAFQVVVLAFDPIFPAARLSRPVESMMSSLSSLKLDRHLQPTVLRLVLKLRFSHARRPCGPNPL